MVLPLNTMTEIIGSFTLAAAARVIGLRTDHHAQVEIQTVAQSMKTYTERVFPLSMGAFNEIAQGATKQPNAGTAGVGENSSPLPDSDNG
jgi:hypothetical protein